MKETVALFVKARNSCSSMRELPKINNHGKFVVPCLISGVEYFACLLILGTWLVSCTRTIVEMMGLVT